MGMTGEKKRTYNKNRGIRLTALLLALCTALSFSHIAFATETTPAEAAEIDAALTYPADDEGSEVLVEGEDLEAEDLIEEDNAGEGTELPAGADAGEGAELPALDEGAENGDVATSEADAENGGADAEPVETPEGETEPAEAEGARPSL